MDYELPDGARRLRASARVLVEAVLRPREGELPAAEGPPPAGLRAACAQARREAGLWGLTVPAALGGRGCSWLEQAVVQEEFHRSLLGLWPHQLLAAGEPPAPLHRTGGAQRARFLQPCLEGERQARQITAAPGQLRLRAVPDGVVAEGRQPAVPDFYAEDLLVVVAELEGEAVGLICEPALAGYRAAQRRPGMGSAQLVDLVWEGCLLEGGRVLRGIGEAARWWEAAQRATVLGAGAVGAAQRCLEEAIRHVQVRRTFGQALAERQAIQWMIADSARELHAARLLVYRAASLADQGADPWRPAAAAKAFATDAACRIVDRVIQMHGGYGYSRDLPFERYWRDLRYYRLVLGGNGELAAREAAQLVADIGR